MPVTVVVPALGLAGRAETGLTSGSDFTDRIMMGLLSGLAGKLHPAVSKSAQHNDTNEILCKAIRHIDVAGPLFRIFAIIVFEFMLFVSKCISSIADLL